MVIGRNRTQYTVPLSIVNRVPSLQVRQDECASSTVRLSNVDCDIGHTFIHYLFTGDYQTLKPSPSCNTPRRVMEFDRSVLAYQAAQSYGLNGLADHAKTYMQLFGEDISIFHIIVLGRQTFPRITEDSWFAEYLTSKIMASFEADEAMFQREEFFEGFGKALDFDRFLGKVMGNAYSQRLSSIRSVMGTEISSEMTTKSIMKEEHLGCNSTTPGPESRDELILQPGPPSNPTQDLSDDDIALSRGSDTWVECEEDGNSN